MNNLDRRENGLLYNVYETGDPSWQNARALVSAVNSYTYPEEARRALEQLLGAYPKSAHVVPPIYCDLGTRVFLGEDSFVNMDCLFLDEGRIVIKDRVLIGPRCSFYTALHPMDPQIRATALECAKGITIEEDVWIAGSCVINAGVTIGKGSVIGSGSVVCKDIPAGVFAAGNPCRVIRVIDEEEKRQWRACYDDYCSDPDTQSR